MWQDKQLTSQTSSTPCRSKWGQCLFTKSYSSSLHQNTEHLGLLFAVPNPSTAIQCKQYWPFQQLSLPGSHPQSCLRICLLLTPAWLSIFCFPNQLQEVGGMGLPMWVVQVSTRNGKKCLLPPVASELFEVYFMLLWLLIEKGFSMLLHSSHILQHSKKPEENS